MPDGSSTRWITIRGFRTTFVLLLRTCPDASWAHGRRKFFDLARLQKAPLAIEAVKRIDALFTIERQINGQPADGRRRVRQAESRPLVDALEAWLHEQRAKLSAKADLAKAIAYSLNRWDALTRFLDDGRMCMTNNAAEREIRAVATRQPLCSPSSSAWKHWKRSLGVAATRATFAGNRGGDALVMQI